MVLLFTADEKEQGIVRIVNQKMLKEAIIWVEDSLPEGKNRRRHWQYQAGCRAASVVWGPYWGSRRGDTSLLRTYRRGTDTAGHSWCFRGEWPV